MTYPHPYSQATKLDKRIQIPRPCYDSALAPMLDSTSLPEEFSLELMRGVAAGDQECPHGSHTFNAESVLRDQPHLTHAEHSITGPDDNEVVLSLFTPKEPSSEPRPVLYHIHGGGMVSGDRFTALTQVIDLLDGIDCVVVSVEHRLAPETRAPGPAEDCYAGLVWVSENSGSLGIDPAAITVFGVSGGGALAAATCLMARDRKSPAIPIKAQMLYSPLLDDRCESLADQQFEYGNPAPTTWLRAIWDHILGDKRGSESVTPYEAPAREIDFSKLPQAYIDAGECEVFRGVAVAYATNMWRCGSTCELHIWPGAFHGFDMMDDPEIPLIHIANRAKANWFKRALTTEAKITSGSIAYVP